MDFEYLFVSCCLGMLLKHTAQNKTLLLFVFLLFLSHLRNKEDNIPNVLNRWCSFRNINADTSSIAIFSALMRDICIEMRTDILGQRQDAEFFDAEHLIQTSKYIKQYYIKPPPDT